jgi:hypothetical protein
VTIWSCRLAGAMIWNVAYVVGSAAVSGGAARPGAEGIVSRPRLVGRLGTLARVTVVSAPPGTDEDQQQERLRNR